MKSLLAAFQFLTVLPVKIALEKEDFERSPKWFPLVGLTIGALAALADGAFAFLGFSGVLKSILTIGFLAALSGGLHLDGLADSADGFLSGRPRKKALEIMRDSRIGTMGVLALLFVLAVKISALAELSGSLRWKALLFAPLAGRSVMIVTMALIHYARSEGGLASIFIRRKTVWPAIWAGGCLLLAVVILFGILSGAVTAAFLFSVTSILSFWSYRRIGGYTGDTLGAASEIVEALAFAALLFA
ncbi:MAG: adenosylcobinamide-GDP ribazoletransferase [Synergistaceae bacterium]|nr:adenosylcobinamide-GDP ribazoletransferase [Synergistaceae bacterium]